MLARKLAPIASSLAFVCCMLLAGNACAASKEVVEFRLSGWKSAHFSSDKDAQKVYDTLKQLGCEAKKHAHDGHQDVSYRCPAWKTVNCKTHDEAHNWEKWLKAYGFETKHTH